MLKLVKCINECGGKALILALKKQPQNFESVHTFFEEILKHEILVSTEINNLVDICLKEKDYTTVCQVGKYPYKNKYKINNTYSYANRIKTIRQRFSF
jgi:ferritin